MARTRARHAAFARVNPDAAPLYAALVEFDEDAWYESLPERLKKKPHRGSNKVAPEAQEMEFRGLKRGFLLSDSSRPARAAERDRR